MNRDAPTRALPAGPDAATEGSVPAGAHDRSPAVERDAVVLWEADLPAFCPNPNMPLWNHHPRVFLDLSHTGAAACPYCGTRYRLAPGAKTGGH